MSGRAPWLAAAAVVMVAAVFAYTAALDDEKSGWLLSGIDLANVAASTVAIGGPPAVAVWLLVRHAVAARGQYAGTDRRRFGLGSVAATLRTCGVGFRTASLRHGIGVGVVAMLGALVGILAVAMPEGARWAETAGVFILDGDAPVGGLTRGTGARDALTSTLYFGMLFWPAWPVIGAGVGAALRHRMLPLGPGNPVAQ